MIQFVHRKNIDDERWDDVVAHSAAETLYPYSWYLDAAAENWSALIMDDHRFIMPLVWKRKFGIRYTYHPNLVQQLGVISKELADPVVIRDFLYQLPGRFRMGTVRFNSKNLVGEEPGFGVTDRTNYELMLSADYSEFCNRYSNNTKRNLKKFSGHALELGTDVSVDELIQFKRNNEIIHRNDRYYFWMRSLFETIREQSKVLIYGAFMNGRLAGAALFAFSLKRAVYLLSVSSEEGKECRAMFGIVDRFIQDHAASGLLLDFEGSNIPSIARFFSGFGAEPVIYQSVEFRRLPGLVRLFKR